MPSGENNRIYTDKQIVELLNKYGSVTAASKHAKIGARAFRRRVKKLNIKNKNNIVIKPETTKRDRKTKTFIITSAQNNTPIHEAFYNNLKVFADKLEAQIFVIPTRYRNVSAFNNEQVQWPKELNGLYMDKDIKLHKHISVLGSVKIQATASCPLSSIEDLTRGTSLIVGHPQIQCAPVGTPMDDSPRLLSTTGSISLPNYSQTKTGRLAENRHNIGAIVVQLRGTDFYWSHIDAEFKTGSFNWYDLRIADSRLEKETCEAIELGDWHSPYTEPKVIKATFSNKDSICKAMKPKILLINDAIDFRARNHHERDDFLRIYGKHKFNCESVYDELMLIVEDHKKYFSKYADKVYYKASNHNDALTRWLLSADYRKDPANLEIYLDLMQQMVSNIKKTQEGHITYPDPLEMFMKDKVEKAVFLKRGKSCIIKGIDCSMHGDKGVDGARGANLKQLARTGYKTITGHTHKFGIFRGAYSVGTSSYLNMGYNSGYSSWWHTHCIIHKSGKRQLVNVVNGKWRI